MMKPLWPKWFGAGFSIGVLFGAGIAFYIAFFLTNGVDAKSNHDFMAMHQLWQKCDDQRSELLSAATLLYELEPGQGIEVLDGLLNLAPGRILGGRDSIGRTVVRWWIPAKVKPVVYDDAHGRAYAWVDTKAGKVEGPFVPEVQR